MIYTIVWLESALGSLRRLRVSDPTSVKHLTAAIRGLGAEPRPDAARQLGASSMYRLRIGDLRAVYEVDDAEAAIHVITVGRLPHH